MRCSTSYPAIIQRMDFCRRGRKYYEFPLFLRYRFCNQLINRVHGGFMRSQLFVSLIPALILCAVCVASSQDVLTYHNNNSRNGLNSTETTLTTTNVNSASFGKLFTAIGGRTGGCRTSLSLRGHRRAAATHNVLIVATEHASVYAFDADSGRAIWKSRPSNRERPLPTIADAPR